MITEEFKLENGESILKNTDRVGQSPNFLLPEDMQAIRHFHESVPGYNITPLCRLNNLAKKLGVKDIFVKDESHRFGLNAFKGLGGVYAVTCAVCKKLGIDITKIQFNELLTPEIHQQIKDMVFITATDGNHGKGVTWAAKMLGAKAYVYMPKGTVRARVRAIEELGASEVLVTDCNYDDTVRLANERALKNGWNLIQDTAWEGYTQIPISIVQGYTTIAGEIAEELNKLEVKPTHLFLQAGVGAYAGGILGYFANIYGKDLPITTIAEPVEIACIYESVKANDNMPHISSGNGETIMAGLNCGEPCLVTWPIVRDFPKFYAACNDQTAKNGMRLLGKPIGDDKSIVSGESGAVCMGLLEAILNDKNPKIANIMGLNDKSVILIISTEGATDPENYNAILNNK